MKNILLGDLHFGEKSNSEKFNSQIIEFLDFVVQYGKEHEIDRVIQLGDYFHNRHQLNVMTMSYGILGAQILSEGFKEVLLIEGNHCMYHKNRLDVTSLSALAPYARIIDEITTVDNMLLTPWILDGEMWDNVVDGGDTHDYLLAHLELNGFKMNDAYVMEHGQSHRELRNYDKVYTGHYHSIQRKDNIVYVGTPYPITMNEANEAHGFFVLDNETGEEEFVEYETMKVVSIDYTDIEELEKLDPENSSVRIEFPDNLDDEHLITEVREYLSENGFNDVKIKYTPKKAQQLLEAEVVTVDNVEDIDLVIKDFIHGSYEIEGIDKSRLTKIYDVAIDMGER